MPIWITGSLVFLVLGLGGFMVSKGRSGRVDMKTSTTVDSGLMVEMSENDIDSMLDRLQMEEAPEPTMGAMCYAVAMMPDSAEYVCPDCGERTVYGGSEADFIGWNLERCRAITADIDSSDLLDATLDESSYCSSCSPDSDRPMLELTIVHNDGRETVSTVSKFDLTVLLAFLRGQLYYSTDNDGTQPLRPYAGRIAELLGVTEFE